MDLKSRINAFAILGVCFPEFKNIYKKKIEEAELLNPWFTYDNICNVFLSWSKVLNSNSLNNWLSSYKIDEGRSMKKILVIGAGNIPLVSFHDCLSVLLSGHHLMLKVSEKDNILPFLVLNHLLKIEPKFKDKVRFIDKKSMKGFDAVIATGSANTFSYFQYYFRDSRYILRSNRSSIAILDGSESQDQLRALCEDVFLYFGLGCRSISLLFLPLGYDLDKLFAVFFEYKYLLNHTKYMRNYDYYKTISSLNNFNILENGFLIMKNDKSLDAPISMLYYSFYNSYSDIEIFIRDNSEKIQSIVSNNHIPFGQSQYPQLSDYADGVDTVSFLCNI